jgi:lipopolysaccharide/colanic/teichoic acid biosynthesis glycosyltransferase
MIPGSLESDASCAQYPLYELPQFLNGLKGDMSVVGPRPPIGSKMREFEVSHLRLLDVWPGITGLLLVQARQDPSFDSYMSLGLTYIENWGVWLEIKIILHTIPAMLRGTGAWSQEGIWGKDSAR